MDLLVWIAIGYAIGYVVGTVVSLFFKRLRDRHANDLYNDWEGF